MPASKKHFVITCPIDNISMLNFGGEISKEEEHFGTLWYLTCSKTDDQFAIHINCSMPNSENWKVEADFGFRLTFEKDTISTVHRKRQWPLGGYFFRDFVSWERFERFARSGCLLEVAINIHSIQGSEKVELRKFDNPELADVTLIVEGRKFHLSKLFLCSQSSHFKALLMGNVAEGNLEVENRGEVVLENVDAQDFQNFLEVLHGENAMNDTTIDGILSLASMYDCTTVIRQCEEFLMEKSKKPWSSKLRLTSRYNLNKLEERCLTEIKPEDARCLLAGDLSVYKGDTVRALIQRNNAKRYSTKDMVLFIFLTVLCALVINLLLF